MTKYIILIALVAFRIFYHPSPAPTTITPFENTSPVKAETKPAPGTGIIPTDKVIADKAVENNKLLTRKFQRFELVWRQRLYYCNLLHKKSNETTYTETFVIPATA